MGACAIIATEWLKNPYIVRRLPLLRKNSCAVQLIVIATCFELKELNRMKINAARTCQVIGKVGKAPEAFPGLSRSRVKSGLDGIPGIGDEFLG